MRIIPARSVLAPHRRVVTRSRNGFALEATLVVLILVGALIGLAATWMLGVTRTGAVDYRSARVQNAVEAGADAVMAQLELAMEDGLLTAAELDALTLPSMSGFTFEAMEAEIAGASEVRTITSGPFAGLFSMNQPVEVEIAARDASSNRSRVVVTVNAQSIPLFQFGIFYEDDLEILPGAPMTFEGWVHTNSNLYLSSNSANFESRITTPDSVIWRRKDNSSERLAGVYINDDAGTKVKLGFDSRTYGNPADFRARSETDFDSRLMTQAHGVSPLQLPLPLGMPAIELIRPRNHSGTDDAQTRNVKYAWKADWHIDVIDLGNPGNLCKTGRSVLGSLRASGKSKPTQAQCEKIFKVISNAFYDRREGKDVDLLEIDVAELRSWVGTNSGRRTEILYVTFTGGSGSSSNYDYPAVRLVNGSTLPNELTIATSHPLYVKGNYNSSSWKPAAIVGDAITFLSPSWNDANQTGTKKNNKNTASAMAVWAAVAAGHSATPCDDFRTGCTSPKYGGGLENFPRFLESWSGKTMTYRGSLVSLFQAERAVHNSWAHVGYYDAPNRDWEFDIRFQDPNNLPPGTPTVGSVFQTAYRPVF